MKLAAKNNAVELAWNAFDAASLRLKAMYTGEVEATREERLQQSLEQARAWYGFLSAFVSENPEVAA
ncbi:hypothetical protein [Sphingomonas sp. MMS24-J13]|uniref:hypothetical protein n=1 Tax=Sphingomonas sp. MMS24-J13 TaxID=3238686 RepID=UPI003850C800